MKRIILIALCLALLVPLPAQAAGGGMLNHLMRLGARGAAQTTAVQNQLVTVSEEAGALWEWLEANVENEAVRERMWQVLKPEVPARTFYQLMQDVQRAKTAQQLERVMGQLASQTPFYAGLYAKAFQRYQRLTVAAPLIVRFLWWLRM